MDYEEAENDEEWEGKRKEKERHDRCEKEEKEREEERQEELKALSKLKAELEIELQDRWREKKSEIFSYRALVSSRSNIFVHGTNGSGKTSFVLDCIKVQSTSDQTFFVNVDCIEYYSERLIAICISQHINILIKNAAKKLCGKKK